MKLGGAAVKPYSSLNYRTMPGCKFFFPCEETGLAQTGAMVDIINGIIYRPSARAGDVGQPVGTISNTTINSVNAVTPVPSLSLAAGGGVLADVDVPLQGAAWPKFGANRAAINFAVGRVIDPTKVKIPIGAGSADVAGADISISMAGGLHTIIRDASLVGVSYNNASVAPAIGTDCYIAIVYDGISSYAEMCAFDGTYFGATATYMAGSGYASEIIPAPYTRASGLSFYGWAGFSFAKMPTDVETTFKWMSYMWSQGKRFLPPNWVKLL